MMVVPERLDFLETFTNFLRRSEPSKEELIKRFSEAHAQKKEMLQNKSKVEIAQILLDEYQNERLREYVESAEYNAAVDALLDAIAKEANGLKLKVSNKAFHRILKDRASCHEFHAVIAIASVLNEDVMKLRKKMKNWG